MAWRQIHDSISSSRSLAELSDAAERLFWRILAQTDAWGRMRGEPVKVRALCAPMLTWNDAHVATLLAELERAGRVQVYEHGDDLCLQVTDFERHQTRPLRNRGVSRFPDPPPVTTPHQWTTSGPLVGTGDRDSESEIDKTGTGQSQEQNQRQAAKDSRTSAVVAALSEIGKPGYLPAKLTVARIDALLVKHPSLDVVDEAEKLRDWETYGAGEGGQTKDGVARFRRWLDKSEEPAANGHEVDYPWLPGCEPKRA